MSINKKMGKLWYTHTREYFTVVTMSQLWLLAKVEMKP